MTKLFEVTLPIVLTNSNGGQQRSWHSSASDRKKYEAALRSADLVRIPFASPVAVELVRNLGPNMRLWDADSILRGSAKGLLDACVACGWFVDDKPQWVSQVIGSQDTPKDENAKRLLASTTIRIYDRPATFDE
jgi:hypothetical protein